MATCSYYEYVEVEDKQYRNTRSRTAPLVYHFCNH